MTNNYYDKSFKDGLTYADMKIIKYLKGTYGTPPYRGHILFFTDNPVKNIARLKKAGLLSDDIVINIENMKISELKEVLRSTGLKVTGKKEELLTRIKENINLTEIKLESPKLFITEKGYAYLNDFRDKIESDDIDQYTKIFQLCKSSNFNESLKKICEYNISLPIQTGIGYDWKERLATGLKKDELEIFNKLEKNDFSTCAIISYLSGKSTFEVIRYHDKIYNTDIKTQIELIRTLESYITNTLEIKSYAKCGIKKYSILTTQDDKTCLMCKKLNNKTFLVKNAKAGLNYPPFHKGCRCTITIKS